MKKILLIEDNESLIFVLSEFLQIQGFDVLVAADGCIGVKLAKDHNPDLILCDISMPNMNGYEVLQYLGQEESTAEIPFFFLGSQIEQYDSKKVPRMFKGYLLKPIDLYDLLAVINSELNVEL